MEETTQTHKSDEIYNYNCRKKTRKANSVANLVRHWLWFRSSRNMLLKMIFEQHFFQIAAMSANRCISTFSIPARIDSMAVLPHPLLSPKKRNSDTKGETWNELTPQFLQHIINFRLILCQDHSKIHFSFLGLSVFFLHGCSNGRNSRPCFVHLVGY